MTQERDYNWDSNTNAWVGSNNKDNGDYVYDANGNPTLMIYYGWDQINSQYKPIEKDVNTYDLSYTLSDLILPLYWVEDGVINKPLELTYYDWDKISSSWGNGYKDVYYYSEISITSVPKTVVSGIDIYPNPCSESVSISFPTTSSQINFELFDLQGRMLIQKEIINHEKISMQGLNSGMYIYKLNIDGKVQIGKLVKE